MVGDQGLEPLRLGEEVDPPESQQGNDAKGEGANDEGTHHGGPNLGLHRTGPRPFAVGASGPSFSILANDNRTPQFFIMRLRLANHPGAGIPARAGRGW